MANISTYAENLLLTVMLKGGSTGLPTAWGVGLCSPAPTSVAANELASFTRGSATFSTKAGTASLMTNVAAIVISHSAAAAQTASGIAIFDATVAGNYLAFQTFNGVALASRSGASIASGALSITLT